MHNRHISGHIALRGLLPVREDRAELPPFRSKVYPKREGIGHVTAARRRHFLEDMRVVKNGAAVVAQAARGHGDR
jgi:hypothetical protein